MELNSVRGAGLWRALKVLCDMRSPQETLFLLLKGFV